MDGLFVVTWHRWLQVDRYISHTYSFTIYSIEISVTHTALPVGFPQLTFDAGKIYDLNWI